MRSIEGLVVWVTGAGTGIGQAAAVKLAEAGALAVLTGRRPAPLEETAAKIAARGGRSEIEAVDIVDAGAVHAAAGRILARHGRIDILVHSAGLNIPQRHWDNVTVEGWHALMDVDLHGAFHCCHAVIPAMRRQRDGLIVNVSSLAGRRTSYMSGGPYSAAKHAMNVMNESINIENCQYGIRATALCPGEVATPILDQRPRPPSPEERARMLQPDDLAETILFLARLPGTVAVHEMAVSPTWNRGFIAGNPDHLPKPIEQP